MSNPAFCTIEERVPLIMEYLKDKDVNATVLIDPDHEHLPDFMMAVTAKMVKNAMEVNALYN